MNWTKDESGPLPVWYGRERIWNVHHNAFAKVGMLLLASIITIIALLGVFNGAPDFVFVMFILPAIIFFALSFMQGSQWMGTIWTLKATPDGLEYYKDTTLIWSAAYRRIARVESGATHEWEASRSYSRGRAYVLPTEYQTAVFTDDLARLVVQTVEQGREECLRLSVDLKAFLDERAALASSSATPDLGGADRSSFFEL